MCVVKPGASPCVRPAAWRWLRPAALIAIALFGASGSRAEETTLRGEVHVPAGYPGELRVELVEITGVPAGVSAAVNVDGSFDLRQVPYGSMVLRLVDPYGSILRQEHIEISANTPPISIRLPERHVERPVNGTVSLRRLTHPPSKKAVKLFQQAQKHSERREYDKAAGALEQAVRISPDFLEARTNLGVQYIRLNDPASAVEQMKAAVGIDPESGAVWSNLAVGLLMLKRAEEAAFAARRALALEPNQAKAQYLLGSALVARPATAAEGLQWLKRAAPEFPPARATLQAMGKLHAR